MMRLFQDGQAPGGVSWDALHLCGAIGDDLVAGYLGQSPTKVVLEKHICALASADQQRRLWVNVGTQSLDAWAAQFSGKGERTRVHGRDAFVRDPIRALEVDVEYKLFLSVPDWPDNVVVVRVMADGIWNPGREPDVPADQVAARQFLDQVAIGLVELSTPRET